LGEGGARGDRAGALPNDEAHLYHHGQGLEDFLKGSTLYEHREEQRLPASGQ
jgi:hypothetical protein